MVTSQYGWSRKANYKHFQVTRNRKANHVHILKLFEIERLTIIVFVSNSFKKKTFKQSTQRLM
jgi:hypothetical protein